MSLRPTRSRRLLVAVLALAALTVSACGSSTSGSQAVTVDPADWDAVLAQAKGQTVNWYMYGGDTVLNTFVSGHVAERLRPLGVTVNQVKITDTADAINKVLGEKQAGRATDGSVDAIWVNGENFATGVQAGLWYCGWDTKTPVSEIRRLHRPRRHQRLRRARRRLRGSLAASNSALVYDSAELQPADVASVSSLFDWAKRNPGRFTYPAPPDFTGSMAVRTILYDTIGGPSALAGAFDDGKYQSVAQRLWPRLTQLEPSLWRGGTTYPQSQQAVEKLYSDGEISAFFTYGPGAVGAQVAKGLYPKTTRQAVPSAGNIANNSFIAIPDNAAHKAAALVLVNVLQEPETQLALYEAAGVYPGIDLRKTSNEIQQRFAAVPVPASVLPLADLTANVQPELAAGYVNRLEKDWTATVLQK